MMGSKEWDLEIKPTRSIWDIGFRDVWAYRDLMFLFVRRDIVSFYKQTVLGPVWFLIQPIFTMAVYLFVFGRLAGLSTAGLPGPIFYLTGITFWTFFSQTLTRTANTLKENEGIFGKVYFPRIVLPISVVFSNLIKLGIQIALLLSVVCYYILVEGFSWSLSLNLFYFPVFLFFLSLQALGFGLIVTSMTTKYRDLVMLLTFGIQLLMYATPIVFPLQSLETAGRIYQLVSYNPISYVIEGIRFSLFDSGLFSYESLIISLSYTLAVISMGVFIFNRVERNFVDTI